MLTEALEAEVQAYIEAARDECDERGHALVVRNGHAREREILLGAGAVEVEAPRVNDKRVDENGQRRAFKSVILPPYMRCSLKITPGPASRSTSPISEDRRAGEGSRAHPRRYPGRRRQSRPLQDGRRLGR